MLQYKILLKGLKFNEEVYESIELIVSGETEDEVDANITSLIYETRLEHMFYKMKYVSKDLIQ